MKFKTANMQICRHFDRWVESIDDPTIRGLVMRNSIITGGSIVTLVTENSVNDYDVYFRDKTTAAAVARYYVAKIQKNLPTRIKYPVHGVSVIEEDDRVKILIPSYGQAGEAQDEDDESEVGVETNAELPELEASSTKTSAKTPFRPVYLTANAITLTDKTQLVLRFFGEPEEIHKNYDFIHCTLYWTSWRRVIVSNTAALESILGKELRYVGSKYPICSLLRVRKFIKRGWTISAGQLLKIAYHVKGIDFSDYAVLEDQLTGVDSRYFEHLISALRAKNPDAIDGNYLMELIDRIN